jgi:ADP-ribosylglycohydrolase
MIPLSERVEGGLLGLLIGDAVGVPYEFNDASALPPLTEIELTPPPNFKRAHADVPPGTWSDDGAQALALLDTLLTTGRVDVVDFAQRLTAWYGEGAYAVDGDVFDVGIQTRQVLARIAAGTPPLAAALADERANGNGSLMRTLPLALYARGSSEELVQAAHLQSSVTHAHPRSQVCCALYCLWARRELLGDEACFASAAQELCALYPPGSAHRRELEDHVLPARTPAGSGYVVDCLHSALYACEAASYEGVVKRAIALGNDTDTTACVAGGIAGIRHGTRGIPRRWLTALRGRDILNPLLARLLRTLGSTATAGSSS